MELTKKQVLENLDQVKTFVSEIDKEVKEKKIINIKIKNRFTGTIIFESEKTTYKEAVMEAINSDADLRNTDLRDADLRDANLRNTDLRGADLCGADLRDADLCGANLRNTDLCGADLCGANLFGANLFGTDLRGADFCGADLRDADFCGADLRDADFCGADLMNTKFYGKGGTKKLKKSQVETFLKALGFVVED